MHPAIVVTATIAAAVAGYGIAIGACTYIAGKTHTGLEALEAKFKARRERKAKAKATIHVIHSGEDNATK